MTPKKLRMYLTLRKSYKDAFLLKTLEQEYTQKDKNNIENCLIDNNFIIHPNLAYYE